VHDKRAALNFMDLVVQVHQGRAGFGLIPKYNQWYKATLRQKRQIVVGEMRRQEDPERNAKAISVAKGQGTNWLNLENIKFSWCDIWEMEEPQLS